MTKVYVVHVKGLHSDDMYVIAGIFTKITLATDRQEFLIRHAAENGMVGLDTWIETVGVDE
jgi:hypothetical protein